MAKNHMAEVAKMLGVELGEEFEIKRKGSAKYKLIEDGLAYMVDKEQTIFLDIILMRILTGYEEIVRRPWRPGMGGMYWTVLRKRTDDEGYITDSRVYFGNEYDLGMIAMGNCFPTRYAAKAAAPEVLKFYEDVRRMVEEE